MKKFVKILSVALVCVMAVAMLAACGANQKSADKINEAAKNEKYWTYNECVKKFGEPTFNMTVSIGSLGATGAVIWVNGCKTSDEVSEKLDAGKKLYALTVTFANGKAASAEYGEYTK